MPISASTTFVYWDKKYFPYDLMTINIEINPIISMFTIMLLQESGWYETNPDYAMDTNWGLNKGCGFFAEQVQDLTCTSKSPEF